MSNGRQMDGRTGGGGGRALKFCSILPLLIRNRQVALSLSRSLSLRLLLAAKAHLNLNARAGRAKPLPVSSRATFKPLKLTGRGKMPTKWLIRELNQFGQLLLIVAAFGLPCNFRLARGSRTGARSQIGRRGRVRTGEFGAG